MVKFLLCTVFQTPCFPLAVLSTAVVYYTSHSKVKMETILPCFFLYIHVARLTSIIIVLHQKSAGHQKSETFAELSIQNAQHLTDRQMMTANVVLRCLQNNQIPINLINLDNVEYPLLLTMLNVGTCLLLLLLSSD